MSCTSAPKGPIFQHVTSIPDQKSLVYIYNTKSTAMPVAVYMGDDHVFLEKNSYCLFYVDPGEHIITAYPVFALSILSAEDNKNAQKAYENQSAIRVEKSRTYYVNITPNTIKWGKPVKVQIEQVHPQMALNEIETCHLESIKYGKVVDVKKYKRVQEDAEKDKAQIKLYRRPNELSKGSYGNTNVGIYWNNEKQFVGVSLEPCQSYDFYVEPGEIKCITGNFNMNESIQALQTLMTGLHVNKPTKGDILKNTGFEDTDKGFRFDAEAGNMYFLAYDPVEQFTVIEKESTNERCLTDKASVVEVKDLRFLDNIQSLNSTVGIGWVKEQGLDAPHYYVNQKNNTLSLLEAGYKVSESSSLKDSDLKRMLDEQLYSPKIDNHYISKLSDKIRQIGITPAALANPFVKTENLSYMGVAESVTSNYVFLLEVVEFGLSRTHRLYYQIANSQNTYDKKNFSTRVGSDPVAFAYIKGIVVDNKTKKVVFNKQYIAADRLSKKWDESIEFFECKEKLDTVMQKAIQKFVDELFGNI